MKKAFTMLELVFVIVVIGILSAVVIPNTKTNPLREAALQVVSHIRYTQHLAIVDDKFDSNDNNWFHERWQLIFGTSASHTDGKIAYSIFSDNESLGGTTPDGNPNLTNDEIARDPQSSDKFLSGGFAGVLTTADTRANKKMNIGSSYNIISYSFSGGCNGDVQISFDHLGRPISGPLNGVTRNASYVNINLIQTTCNIQLVNSEGNITIAIEPETGYAHIL